MTMRRVNQNVFLADTARVLGEVTLGENVNIWYGVSIRGDVAAITIGENTNVQDNAVIHADHGKPNIIGANVTIGHSAICHGLSIGDGTLIGMHATILGGTRIGKNCLIAAGAVVPPNMQVPDGMVVRGLPARIVGPTSGEQRTYLKFLPAHYVKLATRHADEPDHPTIRSYGDS